jgi:DNA-binding transcriptional LysR family regulator
MGKDKAKQKVRVKGPITATDLVALRELAIHGHGLSRLPELYHLDALEDGRLKQVLPDWHFSSSSGHAVYVSRRFMPTRLEVFLDELEKWESPNWRTKKK